MPKSRVVLNRRGFGAVLASKGMEAQLRPYADEIAAKMPGDVPVAITAIRTGVGTANSRVRLRVEAEVWQRARLIAAMRQVLSNAASR